MQKSDREKNIWEAGYLILLAVYLFFGFLGNTMVPFSWTIFQERIWLSILVIYILMRNSSQRLFGRRELCLAVVVFLCLEISRIISGDRRLFCLALLMVGAKGVSFDRIVAVFLAVVGGGLAVVAVCSGCGLVTNLQYKASGRMTSSMGTVYPLVLASMVFYLSLAYIYLRRGRMTIAEAAVLLFLAGAVCEVTTVRFLAVAMLLAVTGALYLKYETKGEEGGGFVRFLSAGRLFMPLFAAIFIGIAIGYDKNIPWMQAANQFFFSAFSYGRKGWNRYGLTPFGAKIRYRTRMGTLEKVSKIFDLKSSYHVLFLNFGLVVLLLVLIGALVIMTRALGEQDFILLLILEVIAFAALRDNHLMQVPFNIFMLLPFSSVYNRQKQISYGIFEVQRKETGRE